MRKLMQAVTLIKEWALETKHWIRGEHMLMAIHSELYDAGLDDQASAAVSELEELRHAPYETTPQPAKIAHEGVDFGAD